MTDTVTRLLDAAERLMKARGWVAVSYRDLAAEVGIRSASIHHHFAAKADLGEALTRRYTTRFMGALHGLDTMGDPVGQMRAYVGLVRDALHGGTTICLCTHMIVDYDLLPDGVRTQIAAFTDDHVDWLTDVLRRGEQEKAFRAFDDVRVTAHSIWSELQGAQILARTFADIGRFDLVADNLLRGLTR
ncbi:TetR/AcrR family transcriptional regulator [Catenuloplanes japonicus]|uniref:TetR/AcrR family transcriptional regulator n=1 Tax=Catenuloplanes japonicus TaxID=33876 RepID=UPI0005253013|nr:TetR/AcrR family transcriptional regulator [Catenuloplanes japonicus]